MTLVDRLVQRCKDAGLEIPKGVQIRRTYAGSNQRSCGAWSWFFVTADGRPYTNGFKGQVGSQYPASVLVKGPISVDREQDWGDINLDPKPEERPMANELQWKQLSNSKKPHLFQNGRSLCGKFLYLGNDYDGPWTGKTNSDDCAGCVKKAQKHHPIKEKKSG